jgi:subtilisin family serine protease
MATPHVSGVAALLLAQRPESTYRQLRVRLAGSVEPAAALENATWSGGRLNAAATLAAGPRVAFVTRLADTPDENGPYTVGAEAVADAAIQSAVLTFTVNSGTPAMVPMPAVGDGAFEAAIPGQSLGSTIAYFVDVADAAGSTARSRTYTFRIGETAVVPGCGDFQFANLRGNQRIGLMALNLMLLVGAVLGARRLVGSRRTPATQKH